MRDVHAKIGTNRGACITFRRKQGFKDEEISRQPTRTIDKLARDYDQSPANEQLRYVVAGSVRVTTANIDLAARALGETEELLKSGVLFDGQQGRAWSIPATWSPPSTTSGRSSWPSPPKMSASRPSNLSPIPGPRSARSVPPTRQHPDIRQRRQ